MIRRDPLQNTFTYLIVFLGLTISTHAFALQPPQTEITASTDIEVLFTPGDDAARKIIDAIRGAKKQILVQAFSFTHPGIAKALIDAHQRGIEEKLIADLEQTRMIRRNRIAEIAVAGVPVWLDGEHNGAHNKVMIIDAHASNIADMTIITGSYNFTNAAQYKNAENVLLIRANRSLAKAYHDNWQRHLPHAQPFARVKIKN